jgi:hypothetical protein
MSKSENRDLLNDGNGHDDLHFVSAALVAANVGGLWGLLQVDPLADMWVTVATYVFAISTPIAVAVAAISRLYNLSSYWENIIGYATLILALTAAGGLLLLFGHFHVGAAIAFGSSTAVAIAVFTIGGVIKGIGPRR